MVVIRRAAGRGKSTVACSLTERLPATVPIKTLSGRADHPAHVEYLGEDDFCSRSCGDGCVSAREELSLNVVLDGRHFHGRNQREQVLEFCSQLQTSWAILECVSSSTNRARTLGKGGSGGRSTQPRTGRQTYITKSKKLGSRLTTPNL